MKAPSPHPCIEYCTIIFKYRINKSSLYGKGYQQRGPSSAWHVPAQFLGALLPSLTAACRVTQGTGEARGEEPRHCLWLWMVFWVKAAIQSSPCEGQSQLGTVGSWVPTGARLPHFQDVRCSSRPNTRILGEMENGEKRKGWALVKEQTLPSPSPGADVRAGQGKPISIHTRSHPTASHRKLSCSLPVTQWSSCSFFHFSQLASSMWSAGDSTSGAWSGGVLC